jgi:hypothetical protein
VYGAPIASHSHVCSCFGDSFVSMARKVDEVANFVFVQLIEQELGIYDKRHSDYARRDKIDLAWEGISHETKESGSRLSSFETTYALPFQLSQKNECTQCFLFLILYLTILLH